MATVFETVIILLHSMAAIFCMILLVILSNNICCVPMEYRPKIANNQIILYSYGALIAFGASDIANILRLCSIDTFNRNDILYNILYESCLYLWRIGQICVYMLFILRMKYSFKTTKYQSPFFHFVLLYVLMFIFLFIQIIFSMEDYIFFHGLHVVSSTFNSKFENSNIWCTEIVDLIISITLLYFFLSKLIRLNIDIVDGMKRTASKNKLSATPNATNSELLINRQQSIIGVMSKFTILSTWVIIFSQLFCFFIGLGYWLCPGYNADDTKNQQTQCMTVWRNAWRAFWAFVSFINCLCIFLSFDFLTLSYYKICGVCDHCCRYSMKQTFNKQNRTISDLFDSDNSDNDYNDDIQRDAVIIYNNYNKDDVPLSVSTNPAISKKESTDMQFHHTIIGTVSSLNNNNSKI